MALAPIDSLLGNSLFMEYAWFYIFVYSLLPTELPTEESDCSWVAASGKVSVVSLNMFQ